MGGVFSQIERIFKNFDEEDRIIYLDASYPQFAFPVRFILGKNVIMGSRKKFDNAATDPVTEKQKRIFLDIIKIWIDDKNIYLVNPKEETLAWLNSAGYSAGLFESESILVDDHLNRTHGKYTDSKLPIYRKINIFLLTKNNNENLLY